MPSRLLGRLGPLVVDRGVQAGLAVLLLLVLADLRNGVLLTATYSASAIVTSMLSPARRTALVAVVCTVLAIALGGLRAEPGDTEWLLRTVIGAILGVLAVISALVRDRREEKLRRMTVIAATAQQALLASAPSSIGDLGLATRYVSATAEAQVGGDLYEVTSTPYGVRLIVGDVKGKGIEAVQVAASVLAAFRQAAYSEVDVAAVARSIDITIGRLVTDEDFVTAIVAEFSHDRLSLANCGHPAPVLLLGHTPVQLDPGAYTLPLGLGADPVTTVYDWPTGARLLFYTDGLSEARDRSGSFFPLEDYADQLADGSLDQALDHLIENLLHHSGSNLGDDLALVLTEHQLSS